MVKWKFLWLGLFMLGLNNLIGQVPLQPDTLFFPRDTAIVTQLLKNNYPDTEPAIHNLEDFRSLFPAPCKYCPYETRAIFRLLISPKGEVIGAVRLRGNCLPFNEALQQSLQALVFSPGTTDGKAVTAWVIFPVNWDCRR
ncbi:MAG: hypothetical protein H6581_02495 [Bacteroidia bacterium]|nr:hypothetical protein [Bacteroidia bacterium]